MILVSERKAIAEVLTGAGIRTVAHVPTRPEPPIAFVVPGSPYLEGGDTFGQKTLRLDMWIVAGQGDNDSLSDALDALIVTALAALEADDLTVENVSQPIAWQPSTGGEYLVAVIGIRTEISTPTPSA
ncbi:hypothetical protein [Microbacterium sp. A94]|uniref:hypothetical protein n=1 Tax=Microbacterium sp. A94 TaxID=3450717 RepID=UPI003F4244C6